MDDIFHGRNLCVGDCCEEGTSGIAEHTLHEAVVHAGISSGAFAQSRPSMLTNAWSHASRNCQSVQTYSSISLSKRRFRIQSCVLVPLALCEAVLLSGREHTL